MASPANHVPVALDNESDYGSDFTPEEEEIVATLLSARVLEDDNPIVNEVEHTDTQSVLKLPRALGSKTESALFQAINAADRVAEDIDNIFKVEEHSHSKYSAA